MLKLPATTSSLAAAAQTLERASGPQASLGRAENACKTCRARPRRNRDYGNTTWAMDESLLANDEVGRYELDILPKHWRLPKLRPSEATKDERGNEKREASHVQRSAQIVVKHHDSTCPGFLLFVQWTTKKDWRSGAEQVPGLPLLQEAALEVFNRYANVKRLLGRKKITLKVWTVVFCISQHHGYMFIVNVVLLLVY